MKTISLIILAIAVLGVGLVLYIIIRQPEARQDVRDLGHDIQRGTKDAAGDAKDAVKDIVK